jgi:membrane protease subunit HflC
MRRLLFIIIIIAIALFILVPQVAFIVDETESVIITRFGEFKGAYQTPGLRIKTPFVDTVTRFDKRLLRIDAPPTSILTKDKRNLVIDAYARYRIVDPLKFFQAIGSETQAETKLADIVNSRLREEVAQDDQSEVISEVREEIMNRVTLQSNLYDIPYSEVSKLNNGVRNSSISVSLISKISGERSRPASEEEISVLQVNPNALDENFEVRYRVPLNSVFGADIIDVRMKRTDFPDAIENSVFARMQAERQRIASGLRAEGSQRDAEIRAEVDKLVTVILQNAQGTASQLVGEAELQAIEILANALGKNPELYDFQRSLEAYRKSLTGKDTLVLSSQSPFFKYLETSAVPKKDK